MRYFPVILLIIVALLVHIASCSFGSKGGSDEKQLAVPVSLVKPAKTTGSVAPDTFVLPRIPEAITDPSERAVYLVFHYWDRFDFTNRRLIDRAEITEQAFVDYINILGHVPREKANESLVYTLEKASVDSLMYRHLVALFEKYLYDPNSPFRNEEMYIPVLNEAVRSSSITEERRSTLLFQQEMVLKNRVGKRAANFLYTLPSGQSKGLYDLKSEYTLLIFSNPGCNTCEVVIKKLEQSKELNRAFSMNTPGRTMLTILTVYPDEDIDEWISHLDKMPATWIHGYDKGMVITHKKLYDIKAIPTLYLLDKEKKVILKDISIETLEAFFQ